jgi:ribosomal protein RSM22 (predicted rRNA methylase)
MYQRDSIGRQRRSGILRPMDMPHELRTGLTRELAATPRSRLTGATVALSERYRTPDAPHGAPILQSSLDIAAYLAYRLPATFAAVHAVLAHVRERLPNWRPRSLLDAGAGPGTATWAALAVWPEIERVTLLERNTAMVAAGKRLMGTARANALRTADWQTADLARGASGPPHDLVVAAYVLGELPRPHDEIVEALWARATGALVLIEPGTPRGFAHIRSARDRLLAGGAATVAPCPHHRPCPMGEGDWCHFAQRTARSAQHRDAKGATLSYEDEKYSYAVMARPVADPIAGRVIRHPITRPGNIALHLCTPVGLEQTTVTRKHAAAFRAARHLRWGSIAPPEVVPADVPGAGDES